MVRGQGTGEHQEVLMEEGQEGVQLILQLPAIRKLLLLHLPARRKGRRRRRRAHRVMLAATSPEVNRRKKWRQAGSRRRQG